MLALGAVGGWNSPPPHPPHPHHHHQTPTPHPTLPPKRNKIPYMMPLPLLADGVAQKIARRPPSPARMLLNSKRVRISPPPPPPAPQVKDVVTIGRGVGLWGDMVVTLKDGSKIEMRALPQ
jgi:hypothetical protein